jgi:adenylate cyclase
VRESGRRNVGGDDVYGDGVNRGATAGAGRTRGILISGPVYDQLHNKLSIGFERLGEQSLKNVAHPVTATACSKAARRPGPRRRRPS